MAGVGAARAPAMCEKQSSLFACLVGGVGEAGPLAL